MARKLTGEQFPAFLRRKCQEASFFIIQSATFDRWESLHRGAGHGILGIEADRTDHAVSPGNPAFSRDCGRENSMGNPYQ